MRALHVATDAPAAQPVFQRRHKPHSQLQVVARTTGSAHAAERCEAVQALPTAGLCPCQLAEQQPHYQQACACGNMAAAARRSRVGTPCDRCCWDVTHTTRRAYRGTTREVQWRRALHWMAHTTLTSALMYHYYFQKTLCIHPRTVAGPCSTAGRVPARTEHVPRAGALQRRAASPLARCQQTHTRREPNSHIATPWLHASPNVPSGAAQRSCNNACAATRAAGTPRVGPELSWCSHFH